MTLASTKLIPELQSWIKQLILNSVVNKFGTPQPVDIDDVYLPQRSFIELLFNDNYSFDSYRHVYIQETSWQSIPYVAKNRGQIYRSFRYYTLDATGENIFTLLNDDTTLLDALLQFRMDSTSLTVIDSTASISLSYDSTADIWILSGNIDSLSTPLSKLIFIYLDFEINDNTAAYDNTSIIGNDILSYAFEVYVLEKIFAVVSARGI